MDIIRREALAAQALPGRIITKCVGGDGPSISRKMTVGFGRYCREAGPMEPHRHAEETVFIVDARHARVRYGASRERMDRVEPLVAGMVLHIPEMEWHVFEYEGDGFLEIMFIYGQTENIRPEEIENSV